MHTRSRASIGSGEKLSQASSVPVIRHPFVTSPTGTSEARWGCVLQLPRAVLSVSVGL